MENSATRVFIVRHGETRWNVEGRIQGHEDSPLTADGLRQAEALAKLIRHEGPAALYASDLGRSRETAAIIARACRLTPRFDERLRERKLGIFEGLTEAEILDRHGAEWTRFRQRNPSYVVPGGESANERTLRAFACLEEVVRRHPGEVVAVVTHGGVLDGLFRIVVGLPLDAPRRFKIVNGALNLFTHEEGTWTLETWGSEEHLSSARSLEGL